MDTSCRFDLFALSLFLFLATVCAASISTDGLAETLQLEKRVTHTGKGTWFYPGLGACGYTDSSSSPIVAISSQIYGSGSNCNQWIQVTNVANGKTAFGKTRDECPSCAAGSLDMSPSLFQQIGDLNTGVLDIQWHYQQKGWAPS